MQGKSNEADQALPNVGSEEASLIGAYPLIEKVTPAYGIGPTPARIKLNAKRKRERQNRRGGRGKR